MDAAQEVAAQPEVAFEVSDVRFDRSPAAEALPRFSTCIGTGGGLWFGGDEQLRGAVLFSSAVASVGDGFVGPVAGEAFDLRQSGFDGVAIVGVFSRLRAPRITPWVLPMASEALVPNSY